MLTKDEGKKKFNEVLSLYRKWKIEQRLTNESAVKSLVRELFVKVLGWNLDDIWEEIHPGPTSRRSDFEFRIDGTTKIILSLSFHIALYKFHFSKSVKITYSLSAPQP
jgi:hypothetical protein